MSQNSRRTPPAHGETRHSAPRPRSAAPLPLPAAASCLAPPRATQQTTQKPASAPPRTCRTAPTVLLSVEDMPRTSLSAGRRRATLIRQAAPSPRAKAAIGWRGAVAVVWAAPMHGSPYTCIRLTSERAQIARRHFLVGGCPVYSRRRHLQGQGSPRRAGTPQEGRSGSWLGCPSTLSAAAKCPIAADDRVTQGQIPYQRERGLSTCSRRE